MLPQRLRTLYCSALLLAASGAASHAGVRQGWGVGMVVTGNRELVLETGRESRAISLAASIWTGGDSRANESDCGDIHRASAWPAVVYSCAAQMRGGASAQVRAQHTKILVVRLIELSIQMAVVCGECKILLCTMYIHNIERWLARVECDNTE